MNKTIFSLLAAGGFLFSSMSSYAEVTLQISQIGVGRATGFANKNGVATDGMRWGVIVSTANATFNGGNYDVFDFNTSGFLTIGGIASDDYYVAHSTSALTQTLSATGGDPGGTGGITTITGVPFGGATGISTSDLFSLVWFDSTPAENSYYGMFTDPGLTIPADTAVQSYASLFAGGTADPIKSANLQFPGAAVVPEPSRLMLLGLGFFGLFFRRRR